jgi:hypothetical protein
VCARRQLGSAEAGDRAKPLFREEENLCPAARV